MTQFKKITTNEVIEHLKEHYGIDDIKFQHKSSEGDSKICEMFDYIEGEIK